MKWLLDTNVVSEFYKRERGSRQVRKWIAGIDGENLYLSVLVLGEIRRVVELARLKDAVGAKSLERWLHDLTAVYANRLLPVSREICDIWGRISIRQQLPDVDGLLAATALHHGLTLATRNTRDLERAGADCFNPFADASP